MIQWCRLWDDMVTDPKFRVVAKRAGRPVSEVIAVFAHMMTNVTKSHRTPTNASERGCLEGWDDEFVAIAIDAETQHVADIREAMQGRTLDGSRLTGWDKTKAPAFTNRLSPCDWYPLRTMVFARDDYTCRYCGQRGGRLECDHVVPLAKGGSNDPENLTTACMPCNRSKRDKLLSEWELVP